MIFNSFFQSFFKHVEELRSRTIKSAGAFALAFLLCYNFIGKLLPALIAPAGRLVFTAPVEAFSAYMTIGCVMALFVSSPYIFYQIWAFVGGALKPSERRFVGIFAPLSLFFFLLGGAFAYWVAVPRAYHFLMSFGSAYMIPMITVRNYLGFLGHMCVAFGVAFEMPLVLGFLAAIGIASPEYLRQKRRHAIVIILILAAVLAPPDIVSMLILSLPLLVLYEVGIVFVRFFYKQPLGAGQT
ncbi:MAG: twin-arginine translocase subunit TatC [Candidatus Omnitrophica bacterium]|nr:twin-arginine translocase subunit TatC [Candidatus Omnitrophota bacterium]MDE2009450.1 twin-arginine translocase subunit TatC [Candidatus Omnitrophota bacterium]MDE2214661.1 twin-arginine translocase subunit TatC [Candidatus Omnitrophota bacterium]MDE2232015.1 twin-arginine translocase subunit TatC [Candidatus Omnitrophota bacterium]